MKTVLALLAAAVLVATPALGAKKSGKLVRGMESGAFVDEYFGIRFTADGLSAAVRGDDRPEVLFVGQTAAGLGVEISVGERAQDTADIDWLARAKVSWDRKMPFRTETAEGKIPRAWTIFVNPDSRSGRRQDGFAFYPSGRLVFTVHLWIPSKSDTSREAIRKALDGLEVKPAPDAFLAAHMVAAGGDADPSSAQSLAMASSLYQRAGRLQSPELAYLSASAANRSVDDSVPASEDWQISYLLGHAQLKTGRNEEAVATWKRCIELSESLDDPDGPNAISHYNLASAYSLLGRTKEAFRELDAALVLEKRTGKSDLRETAIEDSDLANLRADPRWKKRFGAAW